MAGLRRCACPKCHPGGSRSGEPGAGATVRRLTRRWIAPSGGRGSGGGDLGATRLTWTRKREGTTAWRESAGGCEDAEGTVVRGPRDMAKARLLESHVSSGANVHTPRHGVWGRGHRHRMIPSFVISTSRPVGDGQRACSRGRTGRLRHARYVWRKGNSGWPTGREPYGHGVSVVVAGVTACQGGRESRLHGRRDTGAHDRQGTVRYARCETPRPYWRSFVNAAEEDCRWNGSTDACSTRTCTCWPTARSTVTR